MPRSENQRIALHQRLRNIRCQGRNAPDTGRQGKAFGYARGGQAQHRSMSKARRPLAPLQHKGVLSCHSVGDAAQMFYSSHPAQIMSDTDQPPGRPGSGLAMSHLPSRPRKWSTNYLYWTRAGQQLPVMAPLSERADHRSSIGSSGFRRSG